jgi:hypothetical protein
LHIILYFNFFFFNFINIIKKKKRKNKEQTLMLSILNSLLSLWIFMIPLVVAVALDSIYRMFSNESKKRGVNNLFKK